MGMMRSSPSLRCSPVHDHRRRVTKTPVIYAAISDPAAADLTDIDYVTGTSDALNTQSIMDMMFAVQPDIQTVGLLYSNSEANSATPIAEAQRPTSKAKGIALC